MKEIINSMSLVFIKIFNNNITRFIISLLIAILCTLLLFMEPVLLIGGLFITYLTFIIYTEFFGG